jgi:hypothetical protein
MTFLKMVSDIHDKPLARHLSLKGLCHEMNIFLEVIKNQIGTFCICADRERALGNSDAASGKITRIRKCFHRSMQELKKYFLEN